MVKVPYGTRKWRRTVTHRKPENRKSFFDRVEANDHAFTRLEVAGLRWAYMGGKYLHRAQLRKAETWPDGRPVRYFEHVRGAALILVDELEIFDVRLIMALFLHDGREDRREELDWDMVELIGGPELVRILKLLTKEPEKGYIERLWKFGTWKTLICKACDRLDNLRSLPGCGPEKIRKQVKETKEKYFPLFKQMVAVAPPEHKEATRVVFEKIRNLTAILEE
jgi:(p)ppGpp synthase/HD superfamily hydrolase